MGWLLGLIIVAGLIYFAYVSPEARKAVIVVLCVVAAGVTYLLWTEWAHEKQATTAIAVDEVELRGFVTRFQTGVYYAKGGVKNLSATESIEFIQLRVRAHDCPTETLGDDCETVGESVERVRIEVPPGQVRGIDKSVGFSNPRSPRTLVWSYDVVAVRARVD